MEKLDHSEIQLDDKATWMAYLLKCIHKLEQLDLSCMTFSGHFNEKKIDKLITWNKSVCIIFY